MERRERISDIFASRVFSEDVMRERLPKDVYKSLLNTIAMGKDLDGSIADIVASAMKDWAIEHGATHFTHWFQPLTGVTAEKHDAFLTPVGNGKTSIEEETSAIRYTRESGMPAFPRIFETLKQSQYRDATEKPCERSKKPSTSGVISKVTPKISKFVPSNRT